MKNSKTLPIVGLALASLGAGLVLHATPSDAGRPNVPIWVTRPCKTEDSVNCRYVAPKRGNRKGHTFVVRQLPGTGIVCTYFVERQYAKLHDTCSNFDWK